MPKIGVFDSGVGGLRVAQSIAKALPEAEVIYENDREHVPYGTKSSEELLGLVIPILQSLETKGCDVIVIACNTVTTTLIEQLRTEISTPLIGMEPVVRVADEHSKKGKIIVCATPATLGSERYKYLKSQISTNTVVFEPDCSDWAYMIEHNLINREQIQNRITPAIEAGADIIVLGCTHYHWIEDVICEIADDRAVVLQSEDDTIRLLREAIERLS